VTKFFAATPLGFTVRTTESYWELLLLKHPEITGRERDVQETLSRPQQIRRSLRDDKVYLFYRAEGGYYLCVVAKALDREGFVITAYVTDSIKEGERVWPTSA
jgi:hypothetical protein